MLLILEGHAERTLCVGFVCVLECLTSSRCVNTLSIYTNAIIAGRLK